MNGRELGHRGSEESRHAVEPRDERARDVECAPARSSGAEQQRDELGVRQRPGAEREQPLTRPFDRLHSNIAHEGRSPLAHEASPGQRTGGIGVRGSVNFAPIRLYSPLG